MPADKVVPIKCFIPYLCSMFQFDSYCFHQVLCAHYRPCIGHSFWKHRRPSWSYCLSSKKKKCICRELLLNSCLSKILFLIFQLCAEKSTWCLTFACWLVDSRQEAHHGLRWNFFQLSNKKKDVYGTQMAVDWLTSGFSDFWFEGIALFAVDWLTQEISGNPRPKKE